MIISAVYLSYLVIKSNNLFICGIWNFINGTVSFESQQKQEVVIEFLCDDHVSPLELGTVIWMPRPFRCKGIHDCLHWCWINLMKNLDLGYGWFNWMLLSWPDVLKFHQLGTLLNSSKYDLYQFHIVYHGTWCAQPAYRGTLSFISSHFHVYIGFSSIKHLNYMIFLSDSLIFFLRNDRPNLKFTSFLYQRRFVSLYYISG